MSSCESKLREIIGDTKAVIEAIERRSDFAVGRLLDKRAQSIEALKAAGGVGKEPADAVKALSSEVLLLDKQLLSKLEAFKNESGNSAQKLKKKAIGFQKYNYEILSDSGTHLLDKLK